MTGKALRRRHPRISGRRGRSADVPPACQHSSTVDYTHVAHESRQPDQKAHDRSIALMYWLSDLRVRMFHG